MLFAVAFAQAAGWAANPGLGGRVTGEALLDSNIVATYGPSSLAGEVSALVELPYSLEAGLQFGYGRFAGETEEPATWIWYAPVTVTVGARIPGRMVDLFAQAGPSYVLWGEKPGGGEYESSGGKWGVLGEVGARIHTNWVRPSLHHPDEGLRGVDVVAGVGYRWSSRGPQEACDIDECGLQFSALRVSAGLLARF